MKGPSPKREHRRRWPELGEVTSLIDTTRKLRFSVATLSTYAPLAEAAREAGNALSSAGAALERVADLVAGTKTRSRRRRRESEASSTATNLTLSELEEKS